MRLSHSQREMHSSCSEKWRLKYVERLRNPKLSSPLFFGSALDEAFSHLLLTKKEVLTDIELDQQLTKTADDVFYSKMLEIEHNGQTVQLAQSPFADYYASDFSPELLNKKHLAPLQELEKSYSLVDFIEFHSKCKEQIKLRQKLVPDDQILFNYMSWLSLIEKGKMMISAYKDQIMPQIHRVYDIQKTINLNNGTEDSITGLIDFTASFVGNDGTYICDNKTSSKPYSADSVANSEQLSTYCEAENNNKAAYVVVQKQLYKKAPIIHTQVILGTVSEEITVKTFDKFEEMVYSIEQGVFKKNWDSCFSFGRMCEYFALCKHGNADGLVRLPVKVDKV